MLRSESLGYFLFGIVAFLGYLGMAALFILMGLYFWIVAVRAEKKGEMIEVRDVGQTIYRQPWLNKLFAIICFAFSALFIIVGIFLSQ